MKKKFYFGSNFKMYKTASDTEEYLKAITKATADLSRSDYQFFFIPSYTALERASKSPVRDSFMLGAQNGTALLSQPDINGLFTTRTAFQVDKFAALIRESIAACSV